MIGNVWEWTTTPYTRHHRLDQAAQGCCPTPPPAGDPTVHQALKGGSHLCAPDLPPLPARRPLVPVAGQSTTHIGFRCVTDH